MKNQAEIYQALLDGKTLQYKGTTDTVKMVDGNGTNRYGDANNWAFNSPEDWSVVEPTVTLTRAQLENAIDIAYLEGQANEEVYFSKDDFFRALGL
jgi:hypothetical protein